MKYNIFSGGFFSKRVLVMAGALVLCVATAALGVRLLLKSTGSMDGSFEAEVGQGVEILRDGRGTPLIKAAGWDDAFFALGYVHAQDRLIMIEYYRALARGRLVELYGPDAALMDRLASAMDFKGRAADMVDSLSAPYKDYLESYAKGINLAKNRKYREIVRFSRLPDDSWSSRDVVAILLLLDWSQSFLANRELIFALPERLSAYRIRDVIPEDMLFWYSDSEQKNIFALKELRKSVEGFVGSFDSGFACLLPAALIHDAKVRMAFNLDAPMHKYPSWYPVRFLVGAEELEGVGFSGMPFIFSGRNRTMEFASFTAKADIQDFYIETTRKQKDSEQYLGAFGWRDFDAADMAGRRGLRIRSTERGPVLSDNFEGIYRTDCLTIRTVLPGVEYIAALFDVPFAASPAVARARLVDVASPPRAFLFASGEYALRCFSGRLPSRPRGGGAPANRVFNPVWAGVLDISRHFEPAGRDVCVIGDSIGDGAPAALLDALPYNDENRTSRFKDLVSGAGGADVITLQRALRDTHSVTASRFVPLFLRLLEKIPVTSARLARIYFLDWDFRMRKDSVAATIYHTLLVKLIQETLGDELKNEMAGLIEHHHYFSDKFLEAIEDERSPLFDDITTPGKEERRDEIFDRAFLRSMRYLNERRGPIMENWTWGSLHSGRFVVPLVDNDGFWSRMFFGGDEKPLAGGFSTVYRGTPLPMENLKAGVTTCLSGIYDETSATYSVAYSYSINPFSDYFDYRKEYENFAAFGRDDIRHRTDLRPSK
ncbi:MAG TPA: penicillin acylase family protein [Spirochaetota bacterium]|nr:penicillin acylase family protein [Spirochaetota bacterium]